MTFNDMVFQVNDQSILLLVPNLTKDEGDDASVDTKCSQPLISSHNSPATPRQNHKGLIKNPFPKRSPEPAVPEGELRKWHLVREEEECPQGKKVTTIPELYLTRLLSTKVGLT